MTASRVQRQTTRAAFTMERRCLGCGLQRSVRSFKPGGSLCKQCRDHGPPKLTAPAVEPVDERLEAFTRSVRELAGCPRRAG